jgi:uncharacterized protein (TIGR03083 family)
VEKAAVWQTIHAERAALADLLETLADDEWEHESLCAGWRVRHVAAHIISSPQASLRSMAVEMLRARGNFNRCIHEQALRAGARPVDQIVADYRRYAGSRRHPPGTVTLDPLLDILVHTQDIVIPLGRVHAMPPAAAAAAANRVWRVPFPFWARRRFRGFRFAATDVPWCAGRGLTVEGPMEALLLLVTGRTAGLHRLTGEGAPVLARRYAVAM